MPHGVDYTSSVTYGDTFPSKGKAECRQILHQISTISSHTKCHGFGRTNVNS